MTDANTGRQDSAGGRDDGGPGRASVLLGGGLVAVLLVAIGATGGWLLAGEDEGSPTDPLAVATATVTPTGQATTPRPSTGRTTPSAPRTSSTKGSGLTVPPVVGTDFVQARDMLRKQRLGWRLVFGTGTGRTVESSSPAVGATVARGATVQLHVAGPAPAAEVPDVVGDDCADAAADLVEEGLYPRYRSGRTGEVSRQEPAEDGAARWNDEVSIWCGAAAPPSLPSVGPTL
ncbi:PASTA domain-containing protein [Micromonospora sp. RHAY321]|uniref:PASTA domain-containing protein n=1 Tax=Micromonospora sp. RHAY321 TaxID=2944807 RepID=UPI00207D19E5|nr:PASTA domain-containing protein [Micromonospora sp. RHAY321]MCO1596398.1 PASTA domain-containing protein [Micromonospora sp. RHAY321]